MNIKEKQKNAIITSIVGDALGVPVEFSTRQELALCAVKNMLGYGRYDLPEGTWSDDSSMILSTMESLLKGYDKEKLAESFCQWLFDGRWTPYGYAFDSGITTFTALDNIRSRVMSVNEAGQCSEDDNGNGSLMRMLPAALYFADLETDVFLEKIHEVSSITHSHPRAMTGCGIYSLLIRELLQNGIEKKDALKKTVDKACHYYSNHEDFKNELNNYTRIISNELVDLPESEIYSSGYVVHTLEAAIWSFMKCNSSKEVLLEAVNLGLDTDTTGTVAGGLAGLHYGLISIPDEWMDKLAKKDEILVLTDKFVESLNNQSS